MANISQYTSPLEHLPTGADHPIALGVGLVATAVAVYAGRRHYQTHPNEAFYAESADPTLVEDVITDRRHSPNAERRNDRVRTLPAFAFIGGLGLVTSGLIGQVHYSYTSQSTNAEVVIINDTSSSMLKTKDIDNGASTRSVAITKAIDAISFPGALGVIQVAAEADLAVPVSNNWKTELSAATTPTGDPNGGEMESAIRLAASLLPTTADGKRKEGSVIILSDGTVSDDASVTISKEIDIVKADGVKVDAIVPGTQNGSYIDTVGTAPAGSAIQAEVFANANTNKSVTTSADLEQALQNNLKHTGEITHHADDPILGYLGVIIGLSGAATMTFTGLTRKT